MVLDLHIRQMRGPRLGLTVACGKVTAASARDEHQSLRMSPREPLTMPTRPALRSRTSSSRRAVIAAASRTSLLATATNDSNVDKYRSRSRRGRGTCTTSLHISQLVTPWPQLWNTTMKSHTTYRSSLSRQRSTVFLQSLLSH
jgi:hypothetical protein